MNAPVSRRAAREQAAALSDHLRRAFQARLDAGLVPYEGRWVEPAEVPRLAEQARRRRAQIFMELLALNVVVALVGAAFVFLAWAISA